MDFTPTVIISRPERPSLKLALLQGNATWWKASEREGHPHQWLPLTLQLQKGPKLLRGHSPPAHHNPLSSVLLPSCSRLSMSQFRHGDPLIQSCWSNPPQSPFTCQGHWLSLFIIDFNWCCWLIYHASLQLMRLSQNVLLMVIQCYLVCHRFSLHSCTSLKKKLKPVPHLRHKDLDLQVSSLYKSEVWKEKR